MTATQILAEFHNRLPGVACSIECSIDNFPDTKANSKLRLQYTIYAATLGHFHDTTLDGAYAQIDAKIGASPLDPIASFESCLEDKQDHIADESDSDVPF